MDNQRGVNDDIIFSFSETLCDAVHLQSNKQSSCYRLHRRNFPFMINARDKVSVLLASGSLANSSRYEVIIGSDGDRQSKLKRIKDNRTADVLVENITGLLKENELRSFWIEVETDRVVFGSGEKVSVGDKIFSLLVI